MHIILNIIEIPNRFINIFRLTSETAIVQFDLKYSMNRGQRANR